MLNQDAILADIAHLRVSRVILYKTAVPLDTPAIVIGCPSPADPQPAHVLWLDNKRAGVDCVSRLVVGLPNAILAAWAAAAPGLAQPQPVLDRVTLLVEDASPDSVFGVLLLLLRLSGRAPSEEIAPWLASIALWETAGLAAEEPAHEWPVLASALAHAEYGNTLAPTDAELASAWTKGLRFAAECLLAGRAPTDLSALPGSTLFEEAIAALRQEEQTYQDWLAHAQVVQLSLPLRHGNRRRMLVDALLFIEDQPTGAVKALYRNDRARSPLGQGFCFAASLRPGSAAGSGYDLTVTVDPRRGVSLHELWEELERRTDAAWKVAGRERPNWEPRKDMQGRFGTTWNEPWFINENETLLAAPRTVWDQRIEPAKLADGPHLGWDDLLAAIWSACNPLRDVMVMPAKGDAPERLLVLPDTAKTANGRRLLMARWLPATKQGPGAVRSLSAAPVVDRVLAGLIAHGTAHGVPLASLPGPGSWQRVDLSGGIAIVSRHGLFVLDDWREALHLDFAPISHAFHAATQMDTELARLEKDQLEPLTAAMDTETARSAPRELRGLVSRVARFQVELARQRGHAAAVPIDADARAVRQALDAVWALDTRLTSQEQRAKAIADSLKALGDARVRWLTQFVAVVAFPFYVATGLATPLARLFVAGGWLSMPPSGSDPPAIGWWIAFVVLFLPGLALAWAVSAYDHGSSRANSRRLANPDAQGHA